MRIYSIDYLLSIALGSIGELPTGTDVGGEFTKISRKCQ